MGSKTSALARRALALWSARKAKRFIEKGDETGAYVYAKDAAHQASRIIEMTERAMAPHRIIYENQQREEQRIARLDRCHHRHLWAGTDSERRLITEAEATVLFETNPDALIETGDPCGGLLRPVKRAGSVISVQCKRCGRTYPLPPSEPEAFPQFTDESEAA